MRTLLVPRHFPLVVPVALALVAACQRSQSSSGVADTTFVTVMAALKRVQDSTGVDAGRKTALRDSILQSRGLTPARLESAARQLAQNPARAQTVWQAVQRRATDTVKTKPATTVTPTPAVTPAPQAVRK